MTTLKQLQHRTLGALAFTSALALSFAPALAAGPTVTSGGTGEQVNKMAAEAMNTGGTIFGMGCYLAAALCFIAGVWAIWASRQPQNRESGYVARGVAGLVLCGLFVTGGAWINRASATAGAGTTTIDGSSSSMVTFH